MPIPSPRGTYQVISQALRERIAAGAYLDGLPSEADIGREFGVARTTVRRALRALEESGDIKTVAGVGRRVAGGSGTAPYEQIMADLLGQIRKGRLACRCASAERGGPRREVRGVSRHGSPRRA